MRSRICYRVGGRGVLRAERCSIGVGIQSELQKAGWVAGEELQGGGWGPEESGGWVFRTF